MHYGFLCMDKKGDKAAAVSLSRGGLRDAGQRPFPDFVKWMLRNLAAQGIPNVSNGIRQTILRGGAQEGHA